MKKSLSIVSLLLAVVMLAMCCVACGDSKKSDEATIVGTWTTELDFDQLMGAMGESGEGAMQQLVDLMKEALSGIKLKINLTFNEDGTCVAAGDKDSVEAANAKIKSGLTDTLSAMGLPQDQIDTVIGSMDMSSMINGSTLNYETDGNKLFVYEPKEGKDENKYVEYELSSSELKITKVVGEVEQVPEGILPLVLTKAA